jgi:hypothetical protein
MLLANLDQKAEPEVLRLVNGSRGVVTQILPLEQALATVEAGLARARAACTGNAEGGVDSSGGNAAILAVSSEVGGVQTVDQLEAQKAKIEGMRLKWQQQQEMHGVGNAAAAAAAGGAGAGAGGGGGPATLMFPVVRFKNGRVEIICPFAFSGEVHMIGACFRYQVILGMHSHTLGMHITLGHAQMVQPLEGGSAVAEAISDTSTLADPLMPSPHAIASCTSPLDPSVADST